MRVNVKDKGMTGTLDYGSIMNRAMRFFVQQVLSEVSQNGLPGDHHFFITLDTTYVGLEMAPWLHERYPEEITVVMQHWFDNLEVDDIGFSVTLNFGNNPEVLYIPYDAIITFVDPSVEFGVKFEQTDAASKSGDAAYSIARTTNKKETSEKTDQSSAPRRSSPTEEKDADIVRLDEFRKQ
jgi:hypothetical protein